MKKLSEISVVIILLLLISNTAFAGIYEEYWDIYMTSGNGTNDVIISFNIDETPWLYIGSNPDYEILWETKYKLYYESQLIGNGDYTDNDYESWIPIDNWDNYAEVGSWEVSSYSYATCNGRSCGIYGSTSFTVTDSTSPPPLVPEPISSFLFIAGGTLLAGRRYIKRKKPA